MATQDDILKRVGPPSPPFEIPKDPITNTVGPVGDTQKSATQKQDPQTSNRAHFFRTPFTMDCISWRKQNPAKSIVFRCNPNKADYEWPIRGATQNIKSGKVFYWWRNASKGSHFDLPSITFGFQSGNIMVLSADQSKAAPTLYVPEGLDNFHQFMSLYDEVKMLADGTPNFITISHHSHIFPSLSLTGFFDPQTSVNVSETSEDSPLITWSAKFLIHTSEPRFNSASFAETFGKVFEGGNYGTTKIG